MIYLLCAIKIHTRQRLCQTTLLIKTYENWFLYFFTVFYKQPF